MIYQHQLKNLQNKIFFINISKKQNELVSWKSKYSNKSFIFDMIGLKKNKSMKKRDVFFHFNKEDLKIIYIKTLKNIIFSIGADVSVQYQVIEAILGHLIERFQLKYEKNLISDFESGSSHLFKDFNEEIEETLSNFDNLKLIKFIQLYCKFCKKSHMLAVKKSLIETSKKPVISFVYYHDGITLLVYLDRQFEIRGVELVNLSG